MIKIWIGADHAGFEMKQKLVRYLSAKSVEKNYEIHDVGTDSEESVDYPDFADAVCTKLHSWTLIDTKHPENTHLTEVGVLLCGSGQGVAMRANKYSHVRAALCWSNDSTRLSREHNDANVMCLAARSFEAQQIFDMVDLFLSTPFAGGRHQRRVAKVSAPIGE